MIRIKQLNSTKEIQLITGTSPFQASWYLDIFINHFCKKEEILLVEFYQEDTRIGYGAFEKIGNRAIFLGMKTVINGQEVTDYGDIVLSQGYRHLYKEIWNRLMDWFCQNDIVFLHLDYVREDSFTYEYFKDKALKQAIAPYVSLPETWDEYLTLLDRVDRKELKRKMRRLEATPYMYRSIDRSIQADFDEFVRLHKLSSGEKDEFMSNTMKAFFWDLCTVNTRNWKIILSFLQIEGKNTAALMSFENESSVFAYNSGYDSSFNYYSAGLLLHAFKIKEAIEKGKKIYDFMRGTERYKYDLGGKDLKLYKIIVPLEK